MATALFPVVEGDAVRTCLRCGVAQPLDKAHFALKKNSLFPQQGKPAYWAWKCRKCEAAQKRARRSSDMAYRERALARGRAYVADGRNRRDMRERTLRRFGLTEAEYQALAARGCALCGTLFPGGKYPRFHVDHDHITGLFRGLLCHHCNTGLGLLKEDPEMLRRAAAYVEGTR